MSRAQADIPQDLKSEHLQALPRVWVAALLQWDPAEALKLLSCRPEITCIRPESAL